jgi:hypothetical protein
VLWFALLAGWAKATRWLLERNWRIAIVAAGLLGSMPAALSDWLWWFERSSGLPHGDGSCLGLALFNSFALLVWLCVVLRLRQLRPARVSEPAPRPVLQKPPARPLLPRSPRAAQIAAVRARIAGPRERGR